MIAVFCPLRGDGPGALCRCLKDEVNLKMISNRPSQWRLSYAQTEHKLSSLERANGNYNLAGTQAWV
jgi:hypothetical protein